MTTTTLKHPPTDDCDGLPIVIESIAKPGRTLTRICGECRQPLCPCEAGYGHDCEA